MPETTLPAGSLDDVLRQAAADAVTAVPHVVRLEPTLTSALRQLRSATRAGIGGPRPASSSPVDGIDLTRRDTLVDIHVDIATAVDQPADVTALAVLRALEDVVTGQQLTPGLVTVTVLRLHR